MSSDPSVQRLLADGVAAARRKEYGFACGLFQRVIDLEPDNLDALKLLGFARHRAGHYVDAEAVLRRYLSHKPDDEQARAFYQETVDTLELFTARPVAPPPTSPPPIPPTDFPKEDELPPWIEWTGRIVCFLLVFFVVRFAVLWLWDEMSGPPTADQAAPVQVNEVSLSPQALFSPPIPPMPTARPRQGFNLRRIDPAPAVASLVGNRSTKVFHSGSCTYARKIKSGNSVKFSSADAAISNGYRPCQHCRGG